MVPTTLVNVEEYLHTDYSPDYVDGVLEDRNVGQKKHSVTQKRLLLSLTRLEDQMRVFVLARLQ